MQKGRRGGTAWRGSTLAFGDYGLQAIDRGWLTAREIEAARVALTRAHQARRPRLGPGLPRQAAHQEAGRDPHGQGQGAPEVWVAVVKPGRMLFEMEGVERRGGAEALRLAAAKLSLPTQVRDRHPRRRVVQAAGAAAS